MTDEFDLTTAAAGALSVVMPCYNEEATVVACIERVLASPFAGQLIVVDDCSTDRTLALASSVDDERIEIVSLPENGGKGAAVRAGLQRAKKQFAIVQDADLELTPTDWPGILAPLVEDRADVVYGSRYLAAGPRSGGSFRGYLANRFLTTLSNITTGLHLTDMETCYKAFRTDIVSSLNLREDRFGFEPEFTAQVARMKWRVYEVPVSYAERTRAEGKKIGWRDGLRAVYCIVRYAPFAQRIRRG